MTLLHMTASTACSWTGPVSGGNVAIVTSVSDYRALL